MFLPTRCPTPSKRRWLITSTGGGSVFFLVADTHTITTKAFSGTTLESLLPVIFEGGGEKENDDDSVQQFQDMMHSVGGANAGHDREFAADAQSNSGLAPLKNFALPSNYKHSRVADLFDAVPGGTLQSLPKFTTYAQVHGVKAGAEVLAVHPEDKTDAQMPRALLVTQRYGQGQVTVLLTDALWRWRLSLPSTAHDPEIFWQQLFLALARQGSGTGGIRFGLQPFFATLEESSRFRLDGISGGAPTVTAVSPQGKSQVLAAQPDAQAGSWTFQLNPNEPGKWRIRTEDERGSQMETLLRVSPASSTPRNFSGEPPDTEGLRQLAESTGGCLLNDGVPASWSAPDTSSQTTLLSKHSQPLWNNWVILLLALGFYVTELLWRRQAKLL